MEDTAVTDAPGVAGVTSHTRNYTPSSAADKGSTSTPAADNNDAARNLGELQENARNKVATAPTPPRLPAGTGAPGSAGPSAAGGSGGRQPLGELGAAGGGSSGNAGAGAGDDDDDEDNGSSSGDAPRGNRDFVLTKERVAAVRCYFRENDPLFIRANLGKLRDGTLLPLRVGDTVNAARR